MFNPIKSVVQTLFETYVTSELVEQSEQAITDIAPIVNQEMNEWADREAQEMMDAYEENPDDFWLDFPD